MGGKLRISLVQMAMNLSSASNFDRASSLVTQAAEAGSDLIVLPELFMNQYFCKDQDPEYFSLAVEYPADPFFADMCQLARSNGTALVVSFFERSGPSFFNSVVVIDNGGSILGRYRKSHIPDGPGYQEKYYFTPGDTGFMVFDAGEFRVGVGICWDQWFPEAARSMALLGADLIVYPTAIGSEPKNPGYDSSEHWRRVMVGHAAANITPVAAANRVGTELGSTCSIDFYGRSFISDHLGEIIADADGAECIIRATLDLDQAQLARRSWGLFRDRRPDLYGSLTGADSGFTGPEKLKSRFVL